MLSSTITTLLICVLVTSVVADSREKIKSFILGPNKSDPFDLLTEDELQREWSEESDFSIAETQVFQDNIPVIVKLVGFEEEDEAGNITRVELLRYLNALSFDDTVGVIYPLDASQHELLIRKKIIFQVSKLDKPTTAQLKQVVSLYQTKGLNRIPVSEINKIIESDFEKQQQPSYTLYIMKLSPKEDDIYHYYEGSNSVCGTSVYIDTKQRFLWLDISTKQSSYGPHSFGEGMVAPFTIPNIRNYHNIPFQQVKKNLLVDIVSFIEKTCEFLLGASFQFFPAPLANATVTQAQILLVVIHDHAVSPNMKTDLFDWEHIQSKIQQITQISGQSVTFNRVDLSLLTCAHCEAAFSYSVKNALGEKQKIERYLDSSELHFWLQKFHHKITNQYLTSDSLTLPIYLFDISESEVLLLDKLHQSVAFSDMVIGIQTQSGFIFTDMNCDMEPLWGRSDDATKSVLGSILNTGWGVTATHQIWSNIHQRILSDYTWSIVNSPFEPFGSHAGISVAHQDTATRHILYSEIHFLFEDVNNLFSHFLEFGRELDETLSPSENLQFLRRWNLLQFKIEEASKLLSLQDFQGALSFVKTMSFDVEALHKLIHSAGRRLSWDLLCSQSPSKPTFSDLVARTMWWCFIVSPLILVFLALTNSFRSVSVKHFKSE